MEIELVKVWKINESHVITIPHQYIKKGLIIPGKRYNINIEEEK